MIHVFSSFSYMLLFGAMGTQGVRLQPQLEDEDVEQAKMQHKETHARQERPHHSWKNDLKHFGLGKALEGKKKWAIKPLDRAIDRFYKDVRTMDLVQINFNKTNLDREVPSVDGMAVTKKLAYLFMVKDGIDQKQLWHAFFKGASPGSFSIYFHQYKRNTDEAAEQRAFWGEFGAHFIPYVDQGWGHLAGLEYALLWEALRDPANAQFLFLSEGHVPLKSASYIHSYLMRVPDESKICFAHPSNKSHSYTMSAEMANHCSYKDYLQHQKIQTKIKGLGGQEETVELHGRALKHHQWLVVARRHAVDVINHGQDALRQRLKAVIHLPVFHGNADAAGLGASDESFVATAVLLASERAGRAQEDSMKELRQAGVKKECTTFVYWKNCFKHSAFDGEYAWNTSIGEQMRLIKKKVKNTAVKNLSLLDPRKSLVKVWNDTPRNFGLTDAQPDKTYVQLLVTSGLLFARKFGKDEHGQLSRDYSEELPSLWHQFEESVQPLTSSRLAQESEAWPFLDSDNPQVRLTLQTRAPSPE